jgi:hypothetical protein
MTVLDKPHLIVHSEKSLDTTPYDVKWIPGTAKWVVLGQQPNGTGSLHIYELRDAKVELVKKCVTSSAIKCGSFKASALHRQHLATGDFDGRLSIW